MQHPKPIANTSCLAVACRQLGVDYRLHDANHNLVSVRAAGRWHFFANGSTPFNDEALGKICKDKEFGYLLSRTAVAVPVTKGFLDPDCSPEYRTYLEFPSREAILDEIERSFSYPMIVKMNSGSRGTNVFKCGSRPEAAAAIAAIFDRSSMSYDYVAVAQEYVSVSREFRAVVFQGKLEFAYEKEFARSSFMGNLSPLHHAEAKAILVREGELLQRLSEFIRLLMAAIPLEFAGLDIALDDSGKLWLIEINSKPGFEYFVRDNGPDRLVELYKHMVTALDARGTIGS